MLQKNFDTQLIPSLQPLVDESGADAIVATHVDAQGSVRCGQVATESTKNLNWENAYIDRALRSR